MGGLPTATPTSYSGCVFVTCTQEFTYDVALGVPLSAWLADHWIDGWQALDPSLVEGAIARGQQLVTVRMERVGHN